MDSEQRIRTRKELQGPRPAPLKICKHSHNIQKPPQPRSQPFIVYTQSPKIMHIEPHNFMNIVQRLTGSDSSSADDNISIPDGNLYLTKSQAHDQDDLKQNEVMAYTEEIGTSCQERSEISEGKVDHPVKGFPPLSPPLNCFSPSSLPMMSPSMFRNLPIFTPMYSPGQFYRLPEPLFPPPHED